MFLGSATAGVLGVKIGDEIQLAYALPVQREVGQSVITGTSTPRLVAKFIVSGIGTLSGLNSSASNPVMMRLEDAQAWLGTPNQVNQMLLVWQSTSGGSSDARTTVSNARGVGRQVQTDLQAQLGSEYEVALPKYTSLESSSQSFAFAQTFITLYGLLSMGIIGLMVNALMNTTVHGAKTRPGRVARAGVAPFAHVSNRHHRSNFAGHGGHCVWAAAGQAD